MTSLAAVWVEQAVDRDLTAQRAHPLGLEAIFEHALLAGLFVYGEPNRPAVVEHLRQAPVRAQGWHVARPGWLDRYAVNLRYRLVVNADNFACEAQARRPVISWRLSQAKPVAM